MHKASLFFILQSSRIGVEGIWKIVSKPIKKVSKFDCFSQLWYVIPISRFLYLLGCGTEERYYWLFAPYICFEICIRYSVLQDFRSVYTVRYRLFRGKECQFQCVSL